MKGWMTALGSLLVLCAACKPLVLNGGGGGEGGATMQGNAGMGGSEVVEMPSALAMRRADLPADALAIVTSQGGGQVPTDPDTLVLIFTSTSETCAAPLVDVDLQSCDFPMPFWELVLFIPPALEGSGTIDLTSNNIFFYSGELFDQPGPPCVGGQGAGPGTAGTLTIDDSDPSALRLTLSGVTAMSMPIDGVYTAARCP